MCDVMTHLESPGVSQKSTRILKKKAVIALDARRRSGNLLPVLSRYSHRSFGPRRVVPAGRRLRGIGLMRLTKLWQIVLVIGITLPGFALGQEDAAEAEPEGAVEAPADPAAAPKDSPAGEASSAAPTTGPKPASGSPTDPKSETKAEGGAMDGST
jgi:hypothetical protein